MVYKFYLQGKKKSHKYWTLVNEMQIEVSTGCCELISATHFEMYQKRAWIVGGWGVCM